MASGAMTTVATHAKQNKAPSEHSDTRYRRCRPSLCTYEQTPAAERERQADGQTDRQTGRRTDKQRHNSEKLQQ